MEMAGCLGPLLALPGVRLAVDDRPSAGHRRRPPFLPFFFFFPCFFFFLPVTISAWVVARPASFGRPDPTGRCPGADGARCSRPGPGKAVGTPPGLNRCKSQTSSCCRGGPPHAFSPPRPPRVVGLPRPAPSRCLARSWGEQPNDAPLSLSLSSSLGGGTVGRTPSNAAPAGLLPTARTQRAGEHAAGPEPRWELNRLPLLWRVNRLKPAPAYVEGRPVALSPSLLGCLEWPVFSPHQRRSV